MLFSLTMITVLLKYIPMKANNISKNKKKIKSCIKKEQLENLLYQINKNFN